MIFGAQLWMMRMIFGKICREYVNRFVNRSILFFAWALIVIDPNHCILAFSLFWSGTTRRKDEAKPAWGIEGRSTR
jgi:hypothetical protein